LEETDSGEKELSNSPLHLGYSILRHGDTLDLAVHRAAMARELNINTRLACLLASQQEQRKLFANKGAARAKRRLSFTTGDVLLLHKKPEIQCDDDG
jgi:hypothetical protein